MNSKKLKVMLCWLWVAFSWRRTVHWSSQESSTRSLCSSPHCYVGGVEVWVYTYLTQHLYQWFQHGSQVSGFVVRNEVQPAKGRSLGMSVVLKSQPRCNGSTLMLQYWSLWQHSPCTDSPQCALGMCSVKLWVYIFMILSECRFSAWAITGHKPLSKPVCCLLF